MIETTDIHESTAPTRLKAWTRPALRRLDARDAEGAGSGCEFDAHFGFQGHYHDGRCVVS